MRRPYTWLAPFLSCRVLRGVHRLVAVRAMSTSRPTGYRSQVPDADVAPTEVLVSWQALSGEMVLSSVSAELRLG